MKNNELGRNTVFCRWCAVFDKVHQTQHWCGQAYPEKEIQGLTTDKTHQAPEATKPCQIKNNLVSLPEASGPFQ